MTSTHDEPDIRLPKTLKPFHYDLTIVTKLSTKRFGGVVFVDLDVEEKTSDVVLNVAEGLKLLPATLAVLGETFKQEKTSFNKELNQLTIKFPVTLAPGSSVRLRVPFTDNLTDLATGYYYSPFTFNGAKKICTVTQFEPVYGRNVFPCWDEPAFKATFSVTMVSQPETVNVSNMPIVSEHAYTPGDSLAVGPEEDLSSLFRELGFDDLPVKVTKFDETPKMSLYLLAWGNGEFESRETFYASKISGTKRSLKIYGTPDAIDKLDYALKVGADSLAHYEDVFGIEYALPKLDTLVVDNCDFGAMENWGLITGLSAFYQYEPGKSDIKVKKDVVETQSHECAHMWFGNYTTPVWWSSIWLNEGFATLMGEVVIMDRLTPEFDVYTGFIDRSLSRALVSDAQRASHPIQVPIPDVRLINQIFDGLTYSKAASVLRMLMFTVGEKTFFSGVSTYLKAHAFSNAEPKDLWDGIQSALPPGSKLDVAALVDDWIVKIGFPVLTVTETANGIDVRQNRFLDTADVKPEEDTTIWNIPLFLTKSSAIDTTTIMRERQVHIPFDTSSTWKLNGNTLGPYRVSYNPERWEKLAEEMLRPNGAFTTADRMGLISDVFALGQAGKNKTSLALEILSRMSNEPKYLVWVTSIASLSKLIKVWWAESPEYDQLNAFRGRLVSQVVDRVGLDFKKDDKFDTIQLRALVIEQAAYGGNSKVLAHLKALYDKFVVTGDGIHADILEITLIMAVVHGGKPEYDHMKKLYLSEGSSTTLKHGAIAALSSTSDEELLNETFRFMQEDAATEDVTRFFRALGPRRASRRQLADFMLDEGHYKDLRKKYAGGKTWPTLISAAFINLTSEDDVTAIEKFLADKSEDRKQYKLALDQALDTIRASAGWLDRHREDVAEWLKGRNDTAYEA